jgi:hypothetical protein
MDFFSVLFTKLFGGGGGSNEPNGIPIPVKAPSITTLDNLVDATCSVEEGQV